MLMLKNKKEKTCEWLSTLINFVGWLFVLIGIYAALKTSFNLIYYKDKYPVNPVIGFSFVYPRYEEDCYRPPFDLEDDKEKSQEYIQFCINKIKKARKETKQKDIWTSFSFLFIGGGILITKRFYLKS